MSRLLLSVGWPRCSGVGRRVRGHGEGVTSLNSAPGATRLCYAITSLHAVIATILQRIQSPHYWRMVIQVHSTASQHRDKMVPDSKPVSTKTLPCMWTWCIFNLMSKLIRRTTGLEVSKGMPDRHRHLTTA
ncbi:hypothetical protein AVEN_42222-1 [Araneus ventricosus]|uniref:Uncharacterized protein n=1 Tax=Araneus ventricosus TaxID=182803 RepID=A0A4Y2AZF3_ARAVE|nr:hypothetical protein AVEN_42222-1 [Araneus ventricosus]